MKVIVTNKARRDLVDLFYYHLEKSTNYAIKTDQNIRSYIEALKEFPYIGRYVPEITDKHYRELIYEKFRIVYYISEENDTIYILYIFNARQDKKTFFDLHINKKH